ncbi:MAG: apolipoprotein N-acyltransferase, partial [Pseudomonadota bacterium]
MTTVFDRLKGIASNRPGLSSIALGLVAALGHPPLHLWWVSLPALAAFIALLHSAPSTRAAAWYGWLFGWAHLTLANNWIATAFTYQSDMPEILGWFAVPLLCVYLALYPALASVCAYQLARRLPAFAF